MNLYALFSLLSAVLTFFLGSLVLFRSPRSWLHRIFMMLCTTMSWWAFTEFQSRIASTAVQAQFWLSAGSLGPLTVALLLHFVLIFTEQSSFLRNRFLLLLIYVPALTLSVAEFFVYQDMPIQVQWGWVHLFSQSPWVAVENAWFITLGGASMLLCLRQFLSAPSKQMKKMAKYFLAGISIPIIMGIITEQVFPFLQIRVLEMTATSCTLTIFLIAYAIWRYELFALNPTSAAQSIISTMADALFLVNTNHLIQTTNQAALRLLGYQEHELLNHPLSTLFPQNINIEDTTQIGFTRAITGGHISEVESSFKAKDGRIIPVSLSWSGLHEGKSAIAGIILIARDITERIRFRESLQKSRDELELRVKDRTHELTISNDMLRREIADRMVAEERLAAEKEHLAVTLRSIGDGVITTNQQGHITLMNQIAEELCGWSLAEAADKPLWEVLQMVDEYNGKDFIDPITLLEDENSTPTLRQFVGLLIPKSAPKIPTDRPIAVQRVVATSGAPIRDRNGRICGTVLVIRDISERRHHQEEQFKAQRLDSIAVLAGGIAHNFNNTLTGILTSLFVARMHVANGTEIYELISEAERAAFKASNLTKQLMTFSKTSIPLRERTWIRELIEGTIGFCLNGSKSDYHLDIEDDLPMVDVDRGLIDQALTHLIKNAEQAMPQGGTISIRVRKTSISDGHPMQLKAGTYLTIVIADEGNGIPREFLSRIFDPYFSTRPESTGLGLTTAYTILRRHDGSIDVVSTPNEGTAFTMYLPAVVEEVAEEEEATPVPRRSGKGRILIMDDEDYIRASTQRLLTHLGYQALTASDGANALRLYQEQMAAGTPIDIVILDLTITGGMGAAETIIKLQEIDPDVRGLVTSGYTEDPVMTDFVDHGFLASIDKPFDVEELNDKLQRILDKGKSQRA